MGDVTEDVRHVEGLVAVLPRGEGVRAGGVDTAVLSPTHWGATGGSPVTVTSNKSPK